MNLKSGKARQMASGILRDNTAPIDLCDSKPSTSLNICTDKQENTQTQVKKSAEDDGYIRDLDWTHVLATMDVWGKRGITCVNTEGDILPNFTSLNMIYVINPMDACNIQAEPFKMRQITFTHLANESELEMSIGKKHGNTPHANGKVHNVFTCETDAILSPSPLRTQIKMIGTQGKVLYNALLDTSASHNLLSFNAWNRPSLTQLDFKVKGVNGQTSYVLGVLTTIIHCTNGHIQGSFCVMPAGELFENVFLGCTWMAAT